MKNNFKFYKTLWYALYMKYYDDNFTHCDNAFFNNHYHTAEEVKQADVKWIQHLVKQGNSIEEIIKEIPDANALMHILKLGGKIMSNSIMNNSKKEEFKKAMEPAVEWLQKNGTPHDKVIIDMEGAELVSGEMAFSVDVPD